MRRKILSQLFSKTIDTTTFYDQRGIVPYIYFDSRQVRHILYSWSKMWPPCAPWGTKAPKGAWYRDEALDDHSFKPKSSGSLLKPRHLASGSFTRENVKDFEVGVHVPMCSRALLKLGDNRLLLNCSNVVRYSTIRPMDKILHQDKTVSSHDYFYKSANPACSSRACTTAVGSSYSRY